MFLRRREAPAPKAPAPSSGDLLDVGGVPVRLRLNARARRISLRLDHGRREVALVVPSARGVPEALTFALSRRAWIAERLRKLPPPLAFAPDAIIEVAGQPCRLERAAMRIRPALKPGDADGPLRLLAHGADAAAFARAVERALRLEAAARLEVHTVHHCAVLGLPAPTIALQDARGRWGSCRAASPGAPAALRYNWRLVLAPPEVLDYVAAHECAHLIEMNHGPRFWAVVRRLYGDPAEARAWLKANGARLQAIGRA